jgi:hypothetical protein
MVEVLKKETDFVLLADIEKMIFSTGRLPGFIIHRAFMFS